MNIDNLLENIYRELLEKEWVSNEYISLYEDFENKKLVEILSSLHSKFVYLFRLMNERLPTSNYRAHFWAEPSRDLIKTIELSRQIYDGVSKSEYALKIEDYYNDIIAQCDSFLRKSGGSEIPPNTKKILLYYKIPIFQKATTLKKETFNHTGSCALIPIGEGSYARVYKYIDPFYQKLFVLKRAKKDLDEKEKTRFKQEFDVLKKLSSPYVIEVYKYSEENMEYIMEYMDYTLYDFIAKKDLDKIQRKNIGSQILKAFCYINSKKLLHRDISPKNILIKVYENTIVVKISDFGLVKLPDSSLTTLDSEIKGSFNDPNLIRDGFSNYSFHHEIYALTKLLCFVLTGKLNLDKIKDKKMIEFIDNGMNPDKRKRYKSLEELSTAFRQL